MTDRHETIGVPSACDESSGRRWRYAVRARALAAGLCLLSIAASRAPIDAQQLPQVPKIGLLSGATRAGHAVLLEAFRQGMRELGHAEGKTFALEAHYAEGRSERLPDLARELVARKVDLILATTDEPIAAVRRETRTIPIVMVNSTGAAGDAALVLHPTLL